MWPASLASTCSCILAERPQAVTDFALELVFNALGARIRGLGAGVLVAGGSAVVTGCKALDGIGRVISITRLTMVIEGDVPSSS